VTIAEPQGPESSSPQNQNSAPRARLVQRLLDASENLPQFLEDLLRTQAVVVAGTEAAASSRSRA